MNKKLLTYTLAGLVAFGAVSCKKNNAVVDQDPLVVPGAARFISSTATAFYVEDKPNGSFVKLAVGVTDVANVDRKVKLTYATTTGAVAGTHYNGPSEITIPAGQTIDTFEIQGFYDAYPIGRKDVVSVKITAGEGFVNPNAYSTTTNVTLQKLCPVILDDLEGTFNDTRETNSTGGDPYGPYSSTIELTELTPTSAEVVFGQFWDYPVSVKGVIDWSTPPTFTVKLPRQPLGVNYAANQPFEIESTPGETSFFLSCEQSYTLSVDFIVKNYNNTGQDAYYARGYKIYIKR